MACMVYQGCLWISFLFGIWTSFSYGRFDGLNVVSGHFAIYIYMMAMDDYYGYYLVECSLILLLFMIMGVYIY